jgi:hypothetical protein
MHRDPCGDKCVNLRKHLRSGAQLNAGMAKIDPAQKAGGSQSWENASVTPSRPYSGPAVASIKLKDRLGQQIPL